MTTRVEAVKRLYQEHPEILEQDQEYDRQKAEAFWKRLGIELPRTDRKNDTSTSRMHAAAFLDINEALKPKFEEYERLGRASWEAARNRILD